MEGRDARTENEPIAVAAAPMDEAPSARPPRGALSRMFRSSRTRRNDEAVEQLVSMGFEHAQAEAAVARVGTDTSVCVEYILGGAGGADDDDDDETAAEGDYHSVGGGHHRARMDEVDDDDDGFVPRRLGRPGGAEVATVGSDAAEALIRALDGPDQSGRLRDLLESLQDESGADAGDMQWGQLLQALLARVSPTEERQPVVTEEQISDALPETVLTDELLSKHGDDRGECACPLCVENMKLGERVAALPCGHLYHRSPALPSLQQLPVSITVNEHECARVSFEQLSYSAWICDVCLRNQGKGGTFFHDGPIGTPNDNGFDCCVRCAQKHAVLGDEMAMACGGIDAWLMTNPNCPTCRAAALPTTEAADEGAGDRGAPRRAGIEEMSLQQPTAEQAAGGGMHVDDESALVGIDYS